MKIKVCSSCKKKLATTNFFSKPTTKDGFHHQCKLCHGLWRKRDRKLNPEKYKIATKKYKDAHREEINKKELERYYSDHDKNKARKRALKQKYDQLYPERSREASNRSYHRYRERKLVEMRAWRKNNPEIVQILGAINQARRRGAEGSYTREDIRKLMIEQNYKCVYCEKFLNRYHIDHKTPIVRGGTNYIENIQLTCILCNKSKFTKTHEEYLLILNNSNNDNKNIL